MKIYQKYVDRNIHGYLDKNEQQMLSDSIYELCLHNSNKISESLREESWMLESVAEVVGSIQSRMGNLDEIEQNLQSLVEKVEEASG